MPGGCTVRDLVFENISAQSYLGWVHSRKSSSQNTFCQFFSELSPRERKKVFDAVEMNIGLNAKIHLSTHFVNVLLNRFHEHDLATIFAKIRQCVEVALRYDKQESYREGLFIALGYKGSLPILITLYETNENELSTPKKAVFFIGKQKVRMRNPRRFFNLRGVREQISKVKHAPSSPFSLPVL